MFPVTNNYFPVLISGFFGHDCFKCVCKYANQCIEIDKLKKKNPYVKTGIKQSTNELDAGANFSSIRLDAACQALDSVVRGPPTGAHTFENKKGC